MTTINARDLPHLTSGRWNPDRTNDYDTDCKSGREAGATIRAAIADSGNSALLPAVVGAIVSAGEWGAVEIGVFSELGLALA